MSDLPPYGSYPAMPGEPARDPAAPGALPATVANAVRLMLLRAAVSLLSLLALLTSRDFLRTRLRDTNASFTPAQVDNAVSVALTVGAVLGVVFTALYVLLALKVRQGRSWARIVTLVVAGLSALSGVVSLLSPAPGLTRVLGLVALALDIGIIVLLAAKPSSEYFRRTR